MGTATARTRPESGQPSGVPPGPVPRRRTRRRYPEHVIAVPYGGRVVEGRSAPGSPARTAACNGSVSRARARTGIPPWSSIVRIFVYESSC